MEDEAKIRAAFDYMGPKTQAGLTLEGLARGAGVLIKFKGDEIAKLKAEVAKLLLESAENFNKTEDRLTKLNLQVERYCRTTERQQQVINDGLAKERELNRQINELRRHLRYVCNIAARLGPKAHNTHREEAMAMLDGTLRDAEEVLSRTENRKDVGPSCASGGDCYAPDGCGTRAHREGRCDPNNCAMCKAESKS